MPTVNKGLIIVGAIIVGSTVGVWLLGASYTISSTYSNSSALSQELRYFRYMYDSGLWLLFSWSWAVGLILATVGYSPKLESKHKALALSTLAVSVLFAVVPLVSSLLYSLGLTK